MIYLIGASISLAIGLLSLTFTRDEECNIEEVECILVALLISSMSWLMIVIQILAEVRGYYKERKDR
jgi:hypothetical protein